MLELEKAARGQRVHALSSGSDEVERKDRSPSSSQADSSVAESTSTNAVSVKPRPSSAQQGTDEGDHGKRDASQSKSARRKQRTEKVSRSASKKKTCEEGV
jgi:hypothetical protein